MGMIGAGFVLLMVLMAFIAGKNTTLRMFAVGLAAAGSTLGVAGASVYNSVVSDSILMGDGPAEGVMDLSQCMPSLGMLIGAGVLGLMAFGLIFTACFKKSH